VNLGELHRREYGRILASLIRAVKDFDLAEDALQEAFAAALAQWPAQGPPQNPVAWLISTARHKAIDQLRRRALAESKRDDIAALVAEEKDTPMPLDALRLIFTCCHPALGPEAQVALTLRTICGLSTEAIARAFLVPAPTLAQRLVRAKAKIKGARIPYEVPGDDELADRLDSVLTVVYLVFNEGYAASFGAELVRADLCVEAIRLGRLLVELNRAVAIAMADGLEHGLALLDTIHLPGYHLLPAARADLLRRLGRHAEAAAAYRHALALVTNAAERRFLERRLAEITHPAP
jgi:RNA polymerase sigma-70 factor, ECF subfamily